MRKSMVGSWVIGAALALAGCGEAPQEQQEAGVTPLAELKQDLVLGSTGPDVRALHGYLRAYGYFPSSELAARYVHWSPVVAEAPADDGVFDEKTLEALMALQKMSGVEQTGVVDAATRAQLTQPRCGHPDSGAAADPSEKYNLHTRPLVGGIDKWDKSSLSWAFSNTDDGLTTAQLRAAASNAFGAWSAATSLSFSLTTSGEDIRIGFRDVADPPGGNVVGEAPFPSGRGDVLFVSLDTTDVWSVTQEANKIDVQTVLTHEIGHALGLAHSSVPGSIMGPSGNGTRSINADDRFAISVLYDTYQQLPGPEVLSEVDVGANGDVWAINKTPFGDGFRVLKANQTPLTFGWTATDGGAVKIAVDRTGRPWAVSANGTVWRRNSADPAVNGWLALSPGCAKDIDVGSDFSNSVWVTGCLGDAAGNNIYRLEGFNSVTGAATWSAPDGIAEKISVDSTGRPWAITANGSIWRRNSPLASNKGWTNVGACGTDIDILQGNAVIGNGNYAYTSMCGGNRTVWAYDNQASLVDARGFLEPAVDGWWTMNPTNVIKVSSGPDNRLWFINSSNKLFRANK